MRHAPSFRRPLRLLALLLALPLLVLGLGTAPASAANVSNVTFRVPASVQTNPCFPADVVNLSGTVHVVTAVTGSRNGGYRMVQSLNSRLSGASITTGTNYTNSETKNDIWVARAPFPVSHTKIYSFVLVSQSATPNYVLHMTMKTTVTAGGMPVIVVENWHMDCTG